MDIKKSPRRTFLIIGLGSAALLWALLLLVMGRQHWFLLWWGASSVATFGLYCYDKMQAKINGWRVPEAVLLVMPLAGGFIGSLLAMPLCNHKINKMVFWITSVAAAIFHVFIFWQVL